MNSSLFHSIPPAGGKIPLGTLFNALFKTMGHSKDGVEDWLKSEWGGRFILFLSSGRGALWLILKAISAIRPGKKEIVIPAYTCPSIATAILKAGLKPVLCDLNLDDFGLCARDLEHKISKNTLAVIVVHLFGCPADVKFAKEIGRQYDAFVIEDAAQSFGNETDEAGGKRLGMIGDAGFFSFGRGKPISILHGGVLITESKDIYRESLRIYKDLKKSSFTKGTTYFTEVFFYAVFRNPFLYWIPENLPFLHLGETVFEPDFEIAKGLRFAGVLIKEMAQKGMAEQDIRKENSLWYSRNLKKLKGVKGKNSQALPYLRYPLLVEGRDMRNRVLSRLKEGGTGAAEFYPMPLNELLGLKEILEDSRIYRKAKELSESLVTLPVHSGVTPTHRQRIFNILERELSA